MAFTDLQEHLAEVFGLSHGLHYELAVACTRRHELANAAARERMASPVELAKARKRRKARRASDPEWQAQQNAYLRAWRAARPDWVREQSRKNAAWMKAKRASDPAWAEKRRALEAACRERRRAKRRAEIALRAEVTTSNDELRDLLAEARKVRAA